MDHAITINGPLGLKFKRTMAMAAAIGLVITIAAAWNSLSVRRTSPLIPLANAAQVDYFLKIDGIDGESTDNRHGEEIDVLSWSWGETNARSAGRGGGGAGKVSFSDVSFTKQLDKASPKLMEAVATGQHFPQVVLTGRRAGDTGEDYFMIKFSDVLISSYQTGGSAGSEPVDQVSLNFAKIEFEYTPQNADGSLGAPVKAGYDLKANKKV